MSKLDVEKTCRLCCKKKSRMRSLFEQRQEYHPFSLRQIIFDVSRLEVDRDDGLPQKICTWCVTTLLKILKTIENYRSNDLKLRQQLAETLEVEIKQEEEKEVDMGVLEEVFTLELELGEISVKSESMEEEYLDSELHEECEGTDKIDESVSTRMALADSEQEEETVADKDDEEWKPTEQDTEDKEPPVKKYRRRTKQEKDDKGKRKIGRPRTKVEHPNRPRLRDYKCYICNSESHGSPEALSAHLRTHMDRVPYTCPECVMETVVIKGVQGLNVHMRQHLNPEKCTHCDKRFSDKRGLTQHVQTYHRDGGTQTSWKCEYCGEECATNASLIHHMKLHTTAASCEICGKVFKERRKLRLHIQRKHEKLKKYECSICKKKLGSLDSVQVHIKTFHSNQLFKCSYCPKTYGSEASHRFHEKKHIENPEFVAKRDWTEYYSITEGQDDKQGAKNKKKTCHLCGKVTKSMLFHLSTVHFPTEYHCKICGDVFKLKHTYKTHVMEHEHGKAYKCPICEREFSIKRNLINHLRTKKHQDHPLAQSLDWLGVSEVKSKPTEPKKDYGAAQDRAQIEDPELNEDTFVAKFRMFQ